MAKLVDLELSDDEKLDFCAPMPCERPSYPYGTQICLTTEELKKFGKTAADFAIGDAVDMRCFGIVTSVASNKTDDGENARVEIQIQKMVLENEMTEPEMEVAETTDTKSRPSRLYGRR